MADRTVAFRDTPNDPARLEALVLAAVQLDRLGVEDYDRLGTLDFADGRHRLIWEAAAYIVANGGSPTTPVLVDQLERFGKLKSAGGASYVSSLIDQAPFAGDASYNIGILKDRSTKRKVEELSESATHMSRNGQCAADIIEYIREQLDRIGGTEDSDPGIEPLDLAMISAGPVPKPNWIVNPLFACGDMTLLAGEYSCGKTTFLYYLALCLANGRTCCGLNIADPKRVLFIDQEMGTSKAWRRLRQFDMPLPESHLRFYSKQKINLVDAEGIRRLRWAVADFEPDVIMIDSWARMTPGQEDNQTWQITPAYEVLSDLVTHRDCAVVMIDHYGKETMEGKRHNKKWRVRGASGKNDQADIEYLFEHVDRITDFPSANLIVNKHRHLEREDYHRAEMVVEYHRDVDEEGDTVRQWLESGGTVQRDIQKRDQAAQALRDWFEDDNVVEFTTREAIEVLSRLGIVQGSNRRPAKDALRHLRDGGEIGYPEGVKQGRYTVNGQADLEHANSGVNKTQIGTKSGTKSS